MTKIPNSQSQKRFLESIGSLFDSLETNKHDVIFLCSPSDVGVERNGGRNGARLAPQSLISQFKKLSINNHWKDRKIISIQVSDEKLERSDFNQAQRLEAENIQRNLDFTSSICHIGGGHDHVLPLLMAVGKTFNKIIVVNIDAHADTRIDDESHSGNPFRKFADLFDGTFELFQIGLQDFANSKSTLTPLPKNKMEVLWRNELANEDALKSFLSRIQIDPKTALIFSLDCDALSGTEVPGVSAVNGYGLTAQDLRKIWKHFKEIPTEHGPLIGIYELNPVYDSVSMLSMRTISNFIFEIL